MHRFASVEASLESFSTRNPPAEGAAFRHAHCKPLGMANVVGWVSSFVLLATIVAQISKQWSEQSDAGVSPWLFVGQTAASLGFTVYSVLMKNWVFTVTNGLMLLSAIVGWQITAHFKRRRRVEP